MDPIQFVKYFFQFLKATAFKEGELDYTKTSFNPFRLFVIGVVALYLIFNVVYTIRSVRAHTRLEHMCPSIIETLQADIAIEGYTYQLHHTSTANGKVLVCTISISAPVEEVEK